MFNSLETLSLPGVAVANESQGSLMIGTLEWYPPLAARGDAGRVRQPIGIGQAGRDKSQARLHPGEELLGA